MSLFWLPAQLATLAKVVELNGFSAAARALGVPKAAVSRAVADLEAALGVRVLNRTTRRLSLTDAGQLIYPHARRLADEADAARTPDRTLVRAAHRAAAGGGGSHLWAHFAGAPGAAFHGKLSGHPARSESAVPRVRHGFGSGKGSDVAIRTGTGEEPGMAHRLLGSPPAILCATPAYLQRRGTPERPDDLRVARSADP